MEGEEYSDQAPKWRVKTVPTNVFYHLKTTHFTITQSTYDEAHTIDAIACGMMASPGQATWTSERGIAQKSMISC
eukprot:COSAG02_NODE_344_length_24146_cov_12.795983_3_plen_75_part_00